MKIDKVIKELERNIIKENKGIPVMYVVYDPTKPEPNVFYHMIHPDMQNDPKTKNLSAALAARVRKYYQDRPEELERLIEIVKEVHGEGE